MKLRGMLFDLNSAALKPGAYSEINRVADVLMQYPQTSVQIAGHTDSSGAEDYISPGLMFLPPD